MGDPKSVVPEAKGLMRNSPHRGLPLQPSHQVVGADLAPLYGLGFWLDDLAEPRVVGGVPAGRADVAADHASQPREWTDIGERSRSVNSTCFPSSWVTVHRRPSMSSWSTVGARVDGRERRQMVATETKSETGRSSRTACLLCPRRRR